MIYNYIVKLIYIVVFIAVFMSYIQIYFLSLLAFTPLCIY